MQLSKDGQKIKSMRAGGIILRSVLDDVVSIVKPGVTGVDLDRLAEAKILQGGGKPAFKNYHGYPATLCVSVNDEVVHGIPSAKPLSVGDIVSLDAGIIYQNYVTDCATTVIVTQNGCQTIKQIMDKTKPEQFDKLPVKERLLAVTAKSLMLAIKAVKAGATTGDIGHAVSEYVAGFGFGVVRDLVGHGVGESVHQEPSVPNYGKAGSGYVLKEGETIAIEPMVTVGDWHITVDPDSWTIRTKDGSLAAHFEQTVLVTKNGYEILT